MNKDRSYAEKPLLPSILRMIKTLEFPRVLQEFVQESCQYSESEFACLTVLDHGGEIAQIYSYGINDNINISRINAHAKAAFILNDSQIVNDVSAHPEYSLCPVVSAKLRNFLGVPLQIREQIFGRLYLCNRQSDYTQELLEEITTLANVAAVAVENSRLYAMAQNRERWTKVSQELTTILLDGTEEEDALEAIAKSVRKVSEADTACLILPSVGDTWACEIADGKAAHKLIGTVFPKDGRAMTVLAEGKGLIVDSLKTATTLRVPVLADFGPALYAPLIAGGKAIGVLLLLRNPGEPEFDNNILRMAESVATQAALALEMADAKHAEDMAVLLDERTRISEDLHDLAIQQLFATGMQLDRVRDRFRKENNVPVETAISLLDQALASVDESVKQIREIVHNLREPDASVDLIERLRREASLARNSLGFAPSFLLRIDGMILDREASEDQALMQQIDERVGSDVADDVVAVVREALSNTARHAGASSVMLSVTLEKKTGGEDLIKVQVADDGCGLDPQVTRRSGLDNLAARCRRHRGEFIIDRGLNGQGMSITWQVPL